MQPVDYTTLAALCHDLQSDWLPARVEQVYQQDRHTLSLGLRTLEKRGWLTLSWHPQAARLVLSAPPPREPDTFTLSDQLRHQLKGLALTVVQLTEPWERVVRLQFGSRPGEPPQFCLYEEIMGKYSNLILTDGHNQIITAAHQVSAEQSRLRTVQTGQPYVPPPALLNEKPSLAESFESWQERVSLIPGPLGKQLLKTYRGLSPALAAQLLEAADLDKNRETPTLSAGEWGALFGVWRQWLRALEEGYFRPHSWGQGYRVVALTHLEAAPIQSCHPLIDNYYRYWLAEETFCQLRGQLRQTLKVCQTKLSQKQTVFQTRLTQAAGADGARREADLLMAHLHLAQPGLTQATLADFETGATVVIPLQPDKSWLQNAQSLYKQHQKLRRAQEKVLPLLAQVTEELAYLTQIGASLDQLDDGTSAQERRILEDIRDELSEEGYLTLSHPRRREKETGFNGSIYLSPSGYEIWVGRNNRQNDLLTFRLAGDYDLWFHAQEIPGSHVLLRLSPGAVPEAEDLQSAADVGVYFSQARQSDQAPVVYTRPKHVFKPKGAKPGMVVYQRETILWGQPMNIQKYAKKKELD
ncbi:MAG: NFACT RNA binding domain-containing protein [Cyanobacteriota bacterium]|nr:NFACT RNA binding domain-containing protein [Cyanobacteriota bacterium]